MMTNTRLGHAGRDVGILPRFGLLLGLASALWASGCSDHGEGKPSGATCPPTSNLTYATFGMGFFDTYCQRCHGSTVVGAARNGAPDDHVFDTLTDISVMKEHIDKAAAAGATVVNKAMPPSGTAPSDAQRRQLGEWLACGAPE